MLPNMKHDANGGLTIYIQYESPGKDKESNWLSAPKGPFFVAVRLYWPKPEALGRRWSAPPLQHLSELALDREAAPHRAGVTQFFN